MPISDTNPKVQAIYDQMIMMLSGEQRVKMALEVCRVSQEFARAGIRHRHPEWSEKEVMLELFRLAFFPEPLPEWVK